MDKKHLDVATKRYAGILLHPTSFPNPYGIGDLGKGAFDFIDFMEKAGMTAWQVLPLGHTGFGDSPYQPFSSFAGQPLIISIDHLIELDLLDEDDLKDMPQWNPEDISYGDVIAFKTELYRTAYERFIDKEFTDKLSTDEELMADYNKFINESDWLKDYALFMAGKDYHKGAPWYMWDESLKNPKDSERAEWEEKLSKEIGYYEFLQYLFYTEWTKLKEYANQKGISIIGDIPIFVAWDSVDVWRNQKLFMLDSKGYPTDVAGVPPDYFSATGQLWGNPLYNWEEHKKTGYEWWIKRIRHQLELTDFLRIDHFRGFDKFWAVPYGDESAVKGRWIEAPGENFFTMLEANLGYHMPIIAEDLGEIDESVIDLRDKFGFPGMKILQFAFENPNENHFLPHNHIRNCVCYTGTHDNDTTLGWYKHAYEASKDKLRRYYSTDASDICWVMIRACFGSVANMAIIPMQDVLELDSWARFNTPGVGSGNWSWRYKKEALTDQLASRLFETAKMYGR
ncbi:4-alpha-glucanotransferase [Eubacterium ruminantium]|uniref:4-alpha-glucanotransferase n=1 Tax=Eubacterium ruminantium TaxID=42322 RepID=A0A1T4KLL4_9FIRM|nr:MULTISPECIES: 4-alpha-glucanotransferase [Eubacterium]MCR5367026.1 4-alpha-glucanotransferase [Eubacterium sp.]SCW33212.1 4-alpha-glucanotransferase [Eubacterium ruminantium]SDM30150.1 4-alpha-glucanotransferase [Eubacterium ruminantium]SJZ43332.1 4-alpha-glucanotransferase [Eubacterium ruminantium]